MMIRKGVIIGLKVYQPRWLESARVVIHLHEVRANWVKFKLIELGWANGWYLYYIASDRPVIVTATPLYHRFVSTETTAPIR